MPISKITLALTTALLVSSLISTSAQQKTRTTTNWPSFRGSNASGVAEGYKTPVVWDVEKNQNVKWKTPLPGLGHGSPVIWGNQVFVTTALSGKAKDELKVGLYGDIASVEGDAEHQWKIYCMDKRTGKVLWERVVHKGVPKVKRHTKATHANTTLSTDGKNLVAFFGSEGLYCYDMKGNLRWKKDLGMLDSGFYMMPTAQWGFASSPVIHEGRVLVQCDVQKDSFLAAFDIKDGKEIWRTPRKDVPTWSTPTIFNDGKRTQLIVNGWKHIGGYDVKTGQELWKLKGGGDIPVPTPIVAHDLIYITNAHGRMAPIYAIRPDATGDISLTGDAKSNQHIAWALLREGGYMQTPLVYGDYLYVCRDNGVLSCYEAKTGSRIYQQRLTPRFSGFTASSVAADGKLYFTGEDGDIYVVQAGPEFKLLATNQMGEICMATPALSEGVLFYRTRGSLIALTEKKK